MSDTENLQRLLTAIIEGLYNKLTDTKAKLISGFYEDEVPHYAQGSPTHELQELVTAADVQHIVNALHESQVKLARAVEAIEKYGRHYNGPLFICAYLKHSDFPCTCGFDKVLASLEGKVDE